MAEEEINFEFCRDWLSKNYPKIFNEMMDNLFKYRGIK